MQGPALRRAVDVRWRLKFLIAGGLLCGISKLPPLPSEEVEAERRKQQIDQIRDYFGQVSRLHSVAFRLRVANRDDCKDWVWAQIGLDAGTVTSLPRKYRSFTHEALSVSWTQATVLSIADTSPAAAAGIKPGDHLLTFNNEPVPRAETARWIGGFVRNNGERPIQILVRRDGVDEMHTVTPVKACAIPIELRSDSSPNAFATRNGIVIHSSIGWRARTHSLLLSWGMSSRMPILAIWTSSKRTRLLDGPAEQSSTQVSCLVEYRPAARLPENSHAPVSEHSVSVSSAKPTTSAPTMRRGPATISRERKNSGEPSQWKTPTAFESR